MTTAECTAARETVLSQRRLLLDARYVCDGDDIPTADHVGAVDVYGFGVLIEDVFAAAAVSAPQPLLHFAKKLRNAAAARRPTCSQLLSQCSSFRMTTPTDGSVNVFQLMDSLDELSLKPTPADMTSSFNDILANINALPRAMCVYKVLPQVGRAMQLIAVEYQNRNTREVNRQVLDYHHHHIHHHHRL